MEYSRSPVLTAIFERGWRSYLEGQDREAPYDRDTSGPRWRTFAYAWLAGWDAAEEEDYVAQAPGKIPYTDAGISTIRAEVEAQLREMEEEE